MFAVRLTGLLDGRQQWVRLVEPWTGHWLAAYDPDARDGLGEATFTADVADALTFGSFDEAKACWFQRSSLRPMMDGSEYRPLTFCSIEVVELTPETVVAATLAMLDAL